MQAHSIFSIKIYIWILVLLPNYTTAQKPILLEDFSHTVGQKYKRIKNLRTYHIGHGDAFLSIKKRRKDIQLQRFSLVDLKEDIQLRQTILDKGKFITAMRLGRMAIIFYTNKGKAYGQRLAISGKIAEKPKLLAHNSSKIADDFGFKSTYGFDAGGRINRFAFKKSLSNDQLLVIYRLQTGENKPDTIIFHVFDTKLEQIWSKKIPMPHTSNRMEYQDFAIDRAGNFYMTAFVFASPESKKNRGNYTTEVYIANQSSEQIRKKTIDLGAKIVTDAVITQEQNRVTLTGFYADMAAPKNVQGVFKASLLAGKSSDEEIEIFKSALPAQKLQEIQEQRETRINAGTQDDDDIGDFEKIKINKVYHHSDQSCLLLAEQRYAETFTMSSSSGSRTTYKYYYRDILAIKIDENQKIAWMQKLPKYQIGTRGKRSMSYRHFIHQRKHYLFYVDHFANLKRSFGETPVQYYDGKKDFNYLTTYVIDHTTGVTQKEPILTASDIRNGRLDLLELSQSVSLPNKDQIFEVFDGRKNNLLFKIALRKD